MVKSAQNRVCSLVDDFSQIRGDELPVVQPPGELILGRPEAVLRPGRARRLQDDYAERLVAEATLVAPAELGLEFVDEAALVRDKALEERRVVEDVVEVGEAGAHHAPRHVGPLGAQVLGQVQGSGVVQAAAVGQAEGVVQQASAVQRREGVLRNI